MIGKCNTGGGKSSGLYVWKKLSSQGGIFIEYVISDNPNKYPNDGEQSGYYYETVEDVTPEVIAQTSVITQILEGLVGKAQGANATADKILEGYSAYVGQELVEGTLVVPADYGEITISENTTEITVTHNLKRVPTKAVLLANGYSGDTYNNDFYPAVFINTGGLFTNTYKAENTPAIEGCARVYDGTGSGNGTNQSYYKTSLQSELTANTVKFTLKSSPYSTAKFKASSYVWFVA